MLELIIIICLATALFMLLRHYPEAKEGNGSFKFQTQKFKSMFSSISKIRSKISVDSVVIPRFPKGIKEKSFAGEQKNEEIVVKPAAPEKKYTNLAPDLAELIIKAEEAFARNDLREAEDSSVEAISKDKRCPYAYTVIGKVAFSRGQFQDAKEAFKVALKCKKELPEATFYLGRIELTEGNLSEAIDHLQKAIIFDRDNADWYAELGKAYMEVRQFGKAAKVLKRASALDIDNKSYRDLASEAEEKQRSHSSYFRR